MVPRLLDTVPKSQSRRVAALDGLRGFALVGMLAWHAELDWVQGGFARMTIFFVLSGYLATRSWERRRAEGFRSFWVRRTLRLLPMTLVGVGLAIAVTLAVGSPSTKAALGGDVISVLTYTSNWHFLDTGQSYGELFERQSAFQHYWSLSIEEQLFLVLPLVLAGALWGSRRLRRPQWMVLGSLAVMVGGVSMWASPSPDGIYFGTQTRLLEFLVGAALAVSVASWSRRGPVASACIRWAGRASAVGIVVTLGVVDRGSSWLYDGGIYLFAVPVIAVVAAIEVGDRRLTTILELRPLVWLGRAALSIYVLHWPLFVLLEDLAPSNLSEPVLAGVKVAAGVAVGGVAHRLIERPMLDDTRRLLRLGRPVVPARVVPMALTAVVLGVVAVGVPTVGPDYEFDEAAAAFEADRAGSGAADRGGADEHRVAVYGSSTALMNSLGLTAWADGADEIHVDSGDARLGCGLLEHGERPQALDARGERRWMPVDDVCRGWPSDWESVAAELDADVAVVFFGVWEIADWRLGGSDAVTSIHDDAFRRRLGDALDAGIDRLLAGGTEHVVLMSSPEVGGGVLLDAAADRGLPADHAARSAAFNDLLRHRAADRPWAVSVFDYASVIEGLGDDLPRIVPDGVHPTWEGSVDLWSGSAGDELIAHLDIHTR